MIALLCFFLALFVWPFKSKSQLEAENVALRRQLLILRGKARSRVHYPRCHRTRDRSAPWGADGGLVWVHRDCAPMTLSRIRTPASMAARRFSGDEEPRN